MDGKQLWQTALGQLEVTSSRANFITWLKNTKYLTLQDNVLTIGVANIFTKEWLEKKYHEEVLRTCRNLNPDIRNVTYKVSQSNEPAATFKKTSIGLKTNINSSAFEKPSHRYTFDNFIVGSNNRLAHAAASAVAENPGKAYNPLFLYGGVGMGKTHLMHAVGNQIKQNHPDKKVVYCTSEKFTNELVSAIHDKKASEFKRRYRDIDILLVDDIQFIAGKDQTQEEFFHTFNHLYEAGGQIILSSDKPPRAIKTLEDRLCSRFEWGMTADIQPPDLETRMAILQQKIESSGLFFEDKLIAEIARSIHSNIRELEGAITRIIAHCQLNNEAPSETLVEEVLHAIQNNPNRPSITHKKVLSIVSKFYNISQAEITGQKRNKEIVLPRQVSIYIMRKELSLSYPKIGEIMGGRDHTTIMHGNLKMEKLMREDEELITNLTKIKDQLYEEEK